MTASCGSMLLTRVGIGVGNGDIAGSQVVDLRSQRFSDEA